MEDEKEEKIKIEIEELKEEKKIEIPVILKKRKKTLDNFLLQTRRYSDSHIILKNINENISEEEFVLKNRKFEKIDEQEINIESNIQEKEMEEEKKEKVFFENIKATNNEFKINKKLIIVFIIIFILSISVYLIFPNLKKILKREKINKLKIQNYINHKDNSLSNSIIQKSISNACDPNRNFPISILFSGPSFSRLKFSSNQMYNSLKENCKNKKWNKVQLTGENHDNWKNIIYENIKLNEYNIFELDIRNVEHFDYEFLVFALDVENPLVSNLNFENISTKKSVFILLSQYGASNFHLLKKNKNYDQDLKNEIIRQISFEWSNSLINRIMYFIPFLK
jgi:hypothetical protein